MKLTYLINEYPAVSHSFIRREIQALEQQGFLIQRLALRGWNGPVVDQADLAERQSTTFILKFPALRLLAAAITVFVQSPIRFATTVRAAWVLSRRAEKPLIYHAIYLVEACQAGLLIQRHGSTHIHAHFGTNSAEVALLASLLTNLPFSFTVHGPEEFDKPAALHLVNKVGHAAFVIAISSFARGQILRWLERSQWNKVQVIRCGLEKSFHDFPASSVASSHRLVCVGRLCAQKGQLLLIEAMSRLVTKGVTVELVLAGDGEMRPEIESLIEHYSLADKVSITGWLTSSQIRQEILAARALVLPSFAEGLPVVLMEAMSLYRPVLATRVGGIDELVQSGRNGWLFASGSVDELADAIQECLSASKEELAHMGELGHQRVLEMHDIDTEASKLGGYFQYHP